MKVSREAIDAYKEDFSESDLRLIASTFNTLLSFLPTKNLMMNQTGIDAMFHMFVQGMLARMDKTSPLIDVQKRALS